MVLLGPQLVIPRTEAFPIKSSCAETRTAPMWHIAWVVKWPHGLQPEWQGWRARFQQNPHSTAQPPVCMLVRLTWSWDPFPPQTCFLPPSWCSQWLAPWAEVQGGSLRLGNPHSCTLAVNQPEEAGTWLRSTLSHMRVIKTVTKQSGIWPPIVKYQAYDRDQ